MRKNLMKIFLSFFVMAMVAACSEVENSTVIENDAVNVVTNFDKEDVVPADGKTLKLEIKTKLDWKISSNQEWCIVNKTSGSGDAEVSLTVKPNTTSSAREVSIKISCGDLNKTIAINQAKGDDEVVDEDDLIANDFKLDDSNPVLSFSNDFSDVTNDKDYNGSLAVNAARRGDRVWRGAIHKSDKYIKATAHNAKPGQTYESWFITPAFTVDALKDGNVYFDCAVAFYKPTSSLKVFFLELIDGKILPTELSVNIPTEGMYQWTKDIVLNLSQFSGKTGFIGFQYIGEGGSKNSATYCLDNIRFTDKNDNTQGGDNDDDDDINGDNNQGGTHGDVKADRLELPKLRNGANDQFVEYSTTYKGRKVITYSMEYDKSKKHSLWVAFRFDDITSEDNRVGRGSFRNDPNISSRYQRPISGYGGAAYSRGHLVASSDIQYSHEANKQTFYMTNMSPQIQDGFNGGIWLKLERKLQELGRSDSFRDTIYVVKGGTIDDAHVLEYYNNDRSKPVPKYYYMALLSRKNDQFKAIGYWFEHRVHGKYDDFNNYAISIDELEEKTGFDFFHNLPDDLENQVEQAYNVNLWN